MCYVVAKTDVKIRTGPGKGYTPVAQLSRGASLPASCSPTAGGSYTDCGGGYWWVAVTYGGATRYVALACVNWYSDGADAVASEISAETREATVPPTPDPSSQAEG